MWRARLPFTRYSMGIGMGTPQIKDLFTNLDLFVIVVGPVLLFGYFPNASKTWLIVKPRNLDRAQTMFPGGINITDQGYKYLGFVFN